MSAFGGKADMACALQMSAFDPKRTSATYVGFDAELSWTSVQLASSLSMGNDHEVNANPKGQAIGPHGLGAFYGKRTEAVLKSPQRSILGNHLDSRGGNSFGDRTTDGGSAAARASTIRTQAKYLDDHGRRHRVVQCERLQSWRYGLPHSQHRPHR